jgi:hypothetical protein
MLRPVDAYTLAPLACTNAATSSRSTVAGTRVTGSVRSGV